MSHFACYPTDEQYLTVRQMFELDVRYVEEQSLWLDFQICIKTIPAVLRRDGAG